MPTYFCLLGQTPALSWAELKSLFPDQSLPTLLNNSIVEIEMADDQSAVELMNILGGTIKITKLIAISPPVDQTNLLNQVVDILAQSSTKVTFAVAELGRDHLPPLEPIEIKKKLQEKGIPARYLESPRSGLSASVLSHQAVTEIAIIQDRDRLCLTQTVAVQDIDQWTIRDRQKPYFDRKKGMIPPKVARMMTNIALGMNPQPAQWLIDPFCGTGTVLMEAMMRNVPVFGSDLDQAAAEGCKQNLTWLSQQYQLSNQFEVIRQDATHLNSTQLPTAIAGVVTEPFLGKPRPQANQLPGIFKGLSKMYWGMFKQWQTWLPDQCSLVVVFPLVKHPERDTVFSLEGVIDKIAELGYTTAFEPILYHRPQAIVQRQIVRLEYQRRTHVTR